MRKKDYNVIVILQVYNELKKENLKRFFKYIEPLVNKIVVYDDGSTDDSYKYLKKIASYVIRGKENDFSNEIVHKSLLLEKAKKLGAEFILWLDADEVLTNTTKNELQGLCKEMIKREIDGLSMHEINIWRSQTWQRLDSLFDNGWFVRLWRISPKTMFQVGAKGLHQQQYPHTLKRIEKINKIAVLHYGFSTEKNLAHKYLTYKSHGQRGYDMLDRLISEEKLKLKKIPERLFPKELYVDEDEKPSKRSFLESLLVVEKYRERSKSPKYSIVCLIYQSVEWLKFVYEQVLKYTDMTDVEFYFVANDATQEVINYLKSKLIPHYVWRNSQEQRKEWYINNVYRAWNFGAKKAKGKFIIFINSDMAFTYNWLGNLIRSYDNNSCLVSRLVESGKLPSGKYGISKNFGRSILNYHEDQFQEFAEHIKKKILRNSGLFMPLLIKKDDFLSVGGYPEGNVIKGSNIWQPTIAQPGEFSISGDVVLMEKLKKKGVSHKTVFDSIVYHFQEGEKDTNIHTLNLLVDIFDRKVSDLLHNTVSLLFRN